MSEKPKAEQKLVDAVLVKPHTHEGKTYDAGAKIQVNEADHAWLATNKIIETTKEASVK